MRRSPDQPTFTAVAGTTLLAVIAGAGPAFAADLGSLPVKAPPVAASSWTGFYAGLGLSLIHI